MPERAGGQGKAPPLKALIVGNGEFEGLALAPDRAGVVMAADHEHGGIGEAREQLAPRPDRLRGVEIGGRAPVETRHLARVMGDIAGQKDFLAF